MTKGADRQRLELEALKPEGAEMRFSERVVQEIHKGNAVRDRYWGMFGNRDYTSRDAYKYRYDEPADSPYAVTNYERNVFSLMAWTERNWKLQKVRRVRLERGNRNITDLLMPFEVDLLFDAYQEADRLWRAEQSQQQLEEEKKRQRAAWWP